MVHNFSQFPSHFASATAPHSEHFRIASLFIQFWMTGLSCVPRSVQWKASSRMTVGVACAPGALQYQRRRSGGQAVRVRVRQGEGEREGRRTRRVGGPHALDDEPDRVREAHGVVRRVRCPPPASASTTRRVRGPSARTGQEEHLALLDADVAERAVVDDAQEHAALVLVEPLLRGRQRARLRDARQGGDGPRSR